MKRLKSLTLKHKKILSNKVGNIEGWKYAGMGQDPQGNKTHEFKKLVNGKVVDKIFILAD
ncbi:hypothetical protein [Clostridium sp. Ade.TY]|uniref:hypothetical protein n=1 Tax=Clostridium sp. Ade.TY TaxID=1391647 RepID=UPI0003F5C637|nr:hypothetical protein [Clostridium sp. Ade.TY]